MVTLTVPRAVMDHLFEEASAAHPRECCGLLLGEGEVIEHCVPAHNTHPDPETHFEIDPQALIDAHRAARSGSPDVLGYYHSHPVGKAEPSETDAAMASGDGRVWAIIAGKDVRFWRNNPQGFVEVSYRIVD